MGEGDVGLGLLAFRAQVQDRTDVLLQVSAVNATYKSPAAAASMSQVVLSSWVLRLRNHGQSGKRLERLLPPRAVKNCKFVK